jgi:hypothetical protein
MQMFSLFLYAAAGAGMVHALKSFEILWKSRKQYAMSLT